MVSTLVSHMKGTWFDSRCLQILLTSFLLCAKFCPKQISPAYQHQTFPVNVRKNYISFFRKRSRARYGRPSAAWRARRVGINYF